MEPAKLKVLDLFSGIGGFSLGLDRTGGFETVAFCEADPFCRRVLAKHWPGVPCHDDVRTFDAADHGRIDVVTGGFPCQSVSYAGKRRGKDDDRWLWDEMARIVDICRPTWMLGENTFGLITLGLDGVLSDLEAMGYTARPFVIPACAVDAPHRRDRVWIVAYTDGGRRDAQSLLSAKRSQWSDDSHFDKSGEAHGHANGQRSRPIHAEAPGMPGDVADAMRERRRPDGIQRAAASGARPSTGFVNESASIPDPRRGSSQGTGPSIGGCEASIGREPERGLGGDAHGLSEGLHGPWSGDWEAGTPRICTGQPNRVQRLKALGNSVVPAVVERIGHAILAAEQSPLSSTA